MIELPEPKCYTHISWLKAPSGCIVTEPHASFPISLYTADQLRTYGDQRAAEAREQMREECVKLIGKPVWLTWDVRAALITLIRKLS